MSDDTVHELVNGDTTIWLDECGSIMLNWAAVLERLAKGAKKGRIMAVFVHSVRGLEQRAR